MKPTGEHTPFVLPAALLAEVQAAADEEHRPVADVVRDLLERGLAERLKDIRRARTVFRSEELSEAKVKAITEGRMDSRHDYLNAELE